MVKIYIKLFLYIGLLIVVFLNSNVSVACIFILLSGLIMFLFPDKRMRKGFIPTLVLIGATLFGNLFFYPGKVLLDMGVVSITDLSLHNALLRSSRVTVLIVGAKGLFLTSSVEEFISALRRIFSPLKRLGVPVDNFFDTTLLALKNLPEVRKRVSYNSIEGSDSGISRIKGATSVLYSVLLEELKQNNPYDSQNNTDSSSEKRNRRGN
jgi:energy-coupling factor transport system permease protein